MKKVIVALAVLVFAQTVHALEIWCTVDGYVCCEQPDQNDVGMVTIKYSGASAGPVRAFALDISVVSDGAISDVRCLSHQFGYQIYPGSIRIDASGNVTDWGSCKCSGDYPGTLDSPNAMTIEMASAYEDGVDPDPCDAGDLVSFRVEGPYVPEVIITVNGIRGGIVNEDASVEADPNLIGCPVCLCTPTCWDATECGGQAKGDGTCDGSVNFLDLAQLKAAFFSSKGQPNYNCCADYNHDNAVNFLDLANLKVYFFTSGYRPATLNQNCPP